MKLSTVLIGSLLSAASVANAQNVKKIQEEKVIKKESVRVNEAGEPIKLEKTILIQKRAITPPDSLKLKKEGLKKDTTTTKHRPISPDYCPPCGMG